MQELIEILKTSYDDILVGISKYSFHLQKKTFLTLIYKFCRSPS